MAASRIRFTRAGQVFDAFPDLVDTVAKPGTDMTPEAYVEVLRQEDPAFPALAFFAHVLPKREAVWWGHQCVSGLLPPLHGAEAEVMSLSEAWVRDADEDRREAVKRSADALKPDSAPVWVGLAAAWSGGSLSPNPDHRVDTPDDLTPKAVNAALMIAIGQTDPSARSETIDRCIAAGLEFARGEPMPPVAAASTAPAMGRASGGG